MDCVGSVARSTCGFCSVLKIHMVPHAINNPSRVKGIQQPLLTSAGTRHEHGEFSYMQAKTLMHMKLNKMT